MDRIEMLKEAAGIENDLDPDKLDLEADFDPARHDALMSQVFNDNYYNEEAETEKPKFEDEELQRELEEEYEKLKQLDNMAEGTFKYADVIPNSYGLQTEEILFAKDTELNRWCSINRILKYGQRENEEKRIKVNFDHRASNDQIKYKILPSLFSDNIEEQWEVEEERRRKRNLKKKERKKRKLLIKEEEEEEATKNSSKIDTECHDSSKLKNISVSKSEENDDFESEKLNRTESNVDGIENKHSSSKNNDELSADNISFKEDTKLSKKKKKKKKNQKLDDSSTTIEECSEGKTETKHSDDDSQYSEENSIEINNKKLEEKDESLYETMENTLKKKVKRKKNFASKEQFEDSILSSKNIKVNGSTENNFDKLSEPNYKDKSEQTNSVQSATKNKKKRKLSRNDNENKNKSNKKRKLSRDKFEKGNQLQGISDERLLAYGQNPKKIRKSLKYSTKFKSI